MNEERSPLPGDWQDLPLPDADAAWQDMKERLEKKDRRLLPFLPQLFGCLAGAIFLGGIVYGTLQFFGKEKRSAAIATPTVSTRKEDKKTGASKTVISQNQEGITQEQQEQQTNNESSSGGISGNKKAVHKVDPSNAGQSGLKKIKVKSHLQKDPRKWGALKIAGNETAEVAVEQEAIDSLPVKKNFISEDDTRTAIRTERLLLNEVFDLQKAAASPSDTLQAPAIIPTDSLSAAGNQEKTKKRISWKLSAGIGLYQNIRTGRQEYYAAGYDGRKISLQEKLPVPYLRLQYDRWSLQTEFRHGAPRMLPRFSYSRQTVIDPAAGKTQVTEMQLRKTYYHQFPISINYEVLPKWTAGTGIIYSRFYRALAERIVTESYDSIGGPATSRNMLVQIPGFRDSFLYRTQLHLLLQTEYHWNRFSLGLRFSVDAQPYIKYTQPDGAINTRRNHSLEAIIRYRLCRLVD